MRGEETVTGPGVPPSIRRYLLIVLLLLAGWALANAAGVADHPQQSSPAAPPAAEDRGLAPEHGISTKDLFMLLQAGRKEGVLADGTRVTLALDERLQSEIFELFRRFDPPYGVFAAMEPVSGRVIALVGYRRGGASDPRLPLKAIYPAASLVKVITASAAIERGNVSPDEEISYRGGIYRVTRRGIHAGDGRGVPKMTLEEAIARSANAVFGKVAVNRVGGPALQEYLGKFGFGERIPFELPVEPSEATVPRDEYELARTGAGFGDVYVSPLHMAMIMSALAADGAMPRPVLVDRIADRYGKTTYEAAPAKWRDVVLPETARTVVQMMVKTVEMGTSHRTFGTPERTPLLQDMDVAGKTGSLSGWTPPMHFEWFAGVAPVGSPRLALAALVVNDNRWRIKGSYVGKEAFNAYFGYPSSLPPVYRKARGSRKTRRLSTHARKAGAGSAKTRKGRKGAASKKRRTHRKSGTKSTAKPATGKPRAPAPGG